jgi:hypothetical protein
MAKIPAPKRLGDCVTFAGMVVCPHAVYLTTEQKDAVHAMHRTNIKKLSNPTGAAIAKKRKKRGGAARKTRT